MVLRSAGEQGEAGGERGHIWLVGQRAVRQPLGAPQSEGGEGLGVVTGRVGDRLDRGYGGTGEELGGRVPAGRGAFGGVVAVIGVGIGGLIRHTAGAATVLSLIIIGGLTVGQFLPAGWRQYLPGIATQAAVTVQRSAGLLRPGTALAVLAIYAAIALGAAALRVAHRDA